jgi:hypothetical protein
MLIDTFVTKAVLPTETLINALVNKAVLLAETYIFCSKVTLNLNVSEGTGVLELKETCLLLVVSECSQCTFAIPATI